MPGSKTVLFFFGLLAVVQSTAFFLYGSPNIGIDYIDGVVEIIDISESNNSQIIRLNKKSKIPFEDWICSGPASRLQFSEKQITYRLGSMSVVSMLGTNSFKLHSGSFLFCTKVKNSELNISSSVSKAKFIGSGTIIIETTSNGGFKFLPLEARGLIRTEQGGAKTVKSGQLLLVLNNPSNFGDAYDFDLQLMIKSCHLINAFPLPLSTFGRISLAVYSQELRMKGRYEALIGDAPTNEELQIWKFGN